MDTVGPGDTLRAMSAPSESEEMNRAILGICSVIRGLLAGASHNEVMTRHRVGEVLCRIRSMPRAYGKRCVERVAEEIGMTPAKLYRHIAVAECWTPAGLAERMERTNRFGLPLTWSHLVALAKVADSTAREFLLDQCLENAWSVRELSHHVVSLTDRGARAGPGGAVHAALKEGIDFGNRAAADVTLFTRLLAEQLEAIEVEPDEQLVARAIATFQELSTRAESAIAELRGATRSEQRMRCPQEVAPLPSAGLACDDGPDEQDEPAPAVIGARRHRR